MGNKKEQLKELKADLLNLERQAIALNGAMQYIGQKIAALEQKSEKVNRKEETKK